MERYQITSDSSVYYVTFSVVQWLPLFIREEPCKILTDSLNFCIRKKDLIVNAYVLMPTHFHAILTERNADSKRLKAVIDDFRKFTGRSLADWCDRAGPPAFRHAIREEAGDVRGREIIAQRDVGTVRGQETLAQQGVTKDRAETILASRQEE